MTIKTIAVGLMTAQEVEWLVPAACALAERHGAHLIGVHPAEPIVTYMALEASMGELAEPMFLDWQIEETAAIKARFQHFTGAGNFASEWRSQPVALPGAEEFLVDSCRSADLVILGQIDPKLGRRNHFRMQEYAIRQSGRPVLVIPQNYEAGQLGEHLLVGWSNTREAIRAVHDARALAGATAAVDILHVGPEPDEGDAHLAFRRDLAAALNRHGFKTRLLQRAIGPNGVGETLLQVAFEQGADLIVTGAFGHSRVYDFVIGAVTRSLLDTARVPVLFSK
ncbi:MAG: universal stress protein [Pseudorhodobacter sp.]|nr:universal stress protein [Pseudorhodobacter sp.]